GEGLLEVHEGGFPVNRQVCNGSAKFTLKAACLLAVCTGPSTPVPRHCCPIPTPALALKEEGVAVR
ncbi:MAG: hypothetical protein K8R10_11825, partial [Rhodocyclales bacterium]|nr:hypothetical protein [Rhodocyclales bacterium]